MINRRKLRQKLGSRTSRRSGTKKFPPTQIRPRAQLAALIVEELKAEKEESNEKANS